jgi:hypothetical protein
MGLYPRPKGASSPNTSAWQKSFPLWKVRVDGLKPQQAMFQIADNLSFKTFYIAADDWTKGDGRTWGIGKDMKLSAMRQNLSLTSWRYPNIDASMRSSAKSPPSSIPRS